MHHDELRATSAGFPSGFSIGMLQARLVGTFVTDWLGADTIRGLRLRFNEQVWPGDELTCSGEVVAVESTDGGTRVTVDLRCTRRTGGVAISGSAEVVLP
jgi:acyl dehydratase